MILAFIEQRDGVIKKVSYEVVSKAVAAGKITGEKVAAIVCGNEVSGVDNLAGYGLEKLYFMKNPDLNNYSSSAYSELVSKIANQISAKTVLFGNTAMGKDLAPRVAVKLSAGIITDCVELEVSSDSIKAIRPAFAGKARQVVSLRTPVKVFTLRPNVFKAETGSAENFDIETITENSVNLASKVVSVKKSEGKLDVAEADIIVSGGRGLKEAANFNLIENLAEAFGAAVGASRAVVDAGWRPHREQVGQTGKTVSPTLYVACGISGAIQHLAGMSSSKYIVAINKDKDAPIFSVADYGIAGDVFEIIPALTEELKKQSN